MHEDKQLICDLLASALQQTRNQWDLLALQYDDATETVTARYINGGGQRVINVALDSGIAMIRDILDNI